MGKIQVSLARRRLPMEQVGGANRDRTDDLYNAIVALSQLSYGPTSFNLFSKIDRLFLLATQLYLPLVQDARANYHFLIRCLN